MHKRIFRYSRDFTILRRSSGFTIVELLVVIAVIGILAAITIVSYTGISKKATEASLQSDLTNASKTLKMHQVENNAYPTTIDCAQPNSATNKCVKSSSGTTYVYNVDNNASPQAFGLSATKSNITYRINRDSIPLQCAPGFIIVPSSATYGTSDFCVMKYEAKKVGVTNVPISEVAGIPWINISQTDAITYSSNVAGCTGCHLITEAEWMTIAQNVLNVPGNWSTGTVGSGYIFSGHNDTDPNNALTADVSDSNGYSGTNDFSGDAGFTDTMVGNSQRRTLTLSNGEVIWDMAGNIFEWTSGKTNGTTAQQPGVNGAGYTWREWTIIAINNPGSLSPNPSPGATGIAGASAWNSVNGIGRIYSSSDDTSLTAFMRGGNWSWDNSAGILSLISDNVSSDFADWIGFRVSR